MQEQQAGREGRPLENLAERAADLPQRPAFLRATVRVSYGWLAVVVLLMLQWGLFRVFAEREIVSAYPTGFDQSMYLSETYATFDHMVKDGLGSGLKYGILMNLPQGKMMHLQGALLFLLIGPSRLSAMALNFLYFALLELLVVYTLLWLTGRWSLAGLGLALVVTMHSRFLIVGGVVDFRLDSIALCLYGVFICLVVRSDTFLIRPWGLAAGVTSSLLILFRFLTAPTLVLVFATLLLYFALQWRLGGAELRARSLARIHCLLLSGGLVAVVVAPFIWLARQGLRTYYIGQLAKHNDAIRAVEYGANGPLAYWLFYLRSLVFVHLGWRCLSLAAVTMLALFLTSRPRSGAVVKPIGFAGRQAALFLLLAFLVPLTILTMFPVRNPVVGNILTIPGIALIMTVAVWYTRSGESRRSALTRTLAALASLAACFAVYTELSMATRTNPMATDRTSVQQVLQLYDEIASRCQKWGLQRPRMSFDRLADYLLTSHLTCLTYERQGTLIQPASVLGNDLAAGSVAETLAAVRTSDFAVITDPSSPEGPIFPFPFNVAMRQMQSQLEDTANSDLVAVRHFCAYSHRFTLYVRPAVRVEGDSGGWITSQGVTLATSGDMLHDRPVIELVGTTFATGYLNHIRVHAWLEDAKADHAELPVEMDLPIVSGGAVQYRIVIRVDPQDVAADREARVRLTFDRFFVPKEVGMNQDLRELVIRTPSEAHLMR